MAFNASEIVTEPFNTTFSPFTDLFEGMLPGTAAAFFLLPLSIITIALFVKTRDPVMVSMFMMASGALASAGSIFVGAIGMVPVFVIFSALGVTALFVSLFFKR